VNIVFEDFSRLTLILLLVLLVVWDHSLSQSIFSLCNSLLVLLCGHASRINDGVCGTKCLWRLSTLFLEVNMEVANVALPVQS
jgi:hypothetical protein